MDTSYQELPEEESPDPESDDFQIFKNFKFLKNTF